VIYTPVRGETKAKMALARVDLESLLRARKLDNTIAYAPSPRRGDLLPVAGPRAAVFDGGLARGELSEIAGAPSSGRTSLAVDALGSATRLDEPAALVDALDRFDPESAASAGVVLSRLLWVRGAAISVEATAPLRGDEGIARAVDRALKAFTLVVESRIFGLAVCDLADVPVRILRRLPFTTWFRLGRLVAGSRTAALLVASERVGRSAGGTTIVLDGDGRAAARWRGDSDRARLLDGIVPRARALTS
jgi:hypothetical protein